MIRIFALIVSSLVSLHSAQPERWRQYATTDIDTRYFDSVSMRAIGDGVVEVWVKEVRKTPALDSVADPVSQRLIRYVVSEERWLHEINCKARTFTSKSWLVTSPEGRVAYSYSFPNRRAISYAPETVMEYLADAVCRPERF